jgi:hypothetical protein
MRGVSVNPHGYVTSPDAEATSAEGGLGNEITELSDDVANATIPEAAARSLLSGK